VTAGIVHIGVGNFHRAHQCVFSDDALGLPDHASWGYRGIGIMPGDRKMCDEMKGQDCLYTLWQKGVSGDEVRVIGCHSDIIFAPENCSTAVQALSDAATKIVTMTVTEKGYFVDLATGHLDTASPIVAADIEALKSADASSIGLKTAAGYLVAASRQRMTQGGSGFAILSCDNVQENGKKASMAVLEMAEAVDAALATWIRTNVTFPNSMVDRITPATTDELRAQLSAEKNIADGCPVSCESFLLWVVEDNFPHGRPQWEKCTSGTCIFVEDVVPYELMKLRLLNAVHQALSYPAALLGHEFVHNAMADERISKFLKLYMAAAGRTVPEVKGLDKKKWNEDVIDRFSNPAVLDTIFRLVEDATNRIAVALAPCLEDDAIAPGEGLPQADIEKILLPVSCWVQCLLGEAAGLKPGAVKLNRDDRGDAARGPAAEAWEASKSAAAKPEDAQKAALSFLSAAFGAKVARPAVAQSLIEQLKTLQSGGAEALLSKVCEG
jgi:mannitol 2-dehydrogenase